jgi:SpoIVB peptidase S55
MEGKRSGRWRRPPTGVCLGCLSVVAAALLAVSASAAPPTVPLPPCADTVTPDQLSAGQDAVGFTVSHGSTAESFDVEILGVMHSGIAPGRDLIIVAASGPPIDQAGGIWYGMSGSPVYTLDGKLIGAIAYGFSTTSSIAGVTPADPDMLRLLDQPGARSSGLSAAPTRSPRKVRLSDRVRARIARHERVRTSAVDADMPRLEVPVSVSGLTAPRRRAIRRAAIDAHLPFFVPNVAGSSGSAKADSFGTVAPGDSFAAVAAYGDLTFAGIGTTTYVCDGEALAFGHPFNLTGPAVFGASAATAFGIVTDPIFGPYKLAAITDPLGVVDQDRLAGIRAKLERPVRTVPITQDTTSLDTGRSRLGGETDVVRDAEVGFEGSVPFLAWLHSVSNIDAVFDQVSGGSSRISWTIRGIKKHSGAHWKLTRSNRWVSKRDISEASTSELLFALLALDNQRLARIEFTGVHARVKVTEEIDQLTIRKVLWSTHGSPYRRAHRLRVDPGERISARVRMRPSEGGASKTVTMKFRVPHSRGLGLLTIGGGDQGGQRNPLCALGGECGRQGGKAKSFAALLAGLRHRPHNTDLVGELDTGRRSQRVVRRQRQVVTGHSRVLLLIGERHHGRHRHGNHHSAEAVPLPSID